jgi:hypothetical protein
MKAPMILPAAATTTKSTVMKIKKRMMTMKKRMVMMKNWRL